MRRHVGHTCRYMGSSTHDFSSKVYWESTYANNTQKFKEWFINCDDAMPVIKSAVEISEPVVLHAGCGTSSLGSQIACDIPKATVHNVDSSKSVVDLMKGKNKNERCFFTCDDLLESGLASDYYDVCVDKGTLDAFIIGNQHHKYLEQTVLRTLKKGGVFIQFSPDTPESRDFLLLGGKWSRCYWKNIETKDDFEYYAYICHKA